MEPSTVILHIALILIFARIFGELAGRLKIPPVLGELFAGILLGPSLLNLIELNELMTTLAELGVILLLFDIGVKTHFGQLLRAGGQSAIVALGGVLVPFVTCFFCAHYLFELNFLSSLLIAGTMTATSIGITMRTLTDLGRHNTKEGQIVLGAAVIDDILGVLLLAILFDFAAKGQTDYSQISKTLLFTIGFLLLTPVIARLFAHMVNLFEPFSTEPGIVPTSIVALLLLTGWLSHLIGLPMLLGGFVVGLALSKQFHLKALEKTNSDQHFCHKVEKQMRPLVQLFTPIFFVSIGLSLDLAQIDWSSPFFWTFSIGLTLIAMASKIAAAFFIKQSLFTRFVIGIAMMPRGEVGLIFAGLGKASGLFTDEVYLAVIAVIIYTTLLTPILLKYAYRQGLRCDKAI